MKDEGKKRLLDFLAFILHPSAFIHVFLLRPRTYPQHMPSLLPLLRSRPGGVHKTSIVRSPGSDESLNHCRLKIANCGGGLVSGGTRILRVIPRAGRPCHFFKLTHTPVAGGTDKTCGFCYW